MSSLADVLLIVSISFIFVILAALVYMYIVRGQDGLPKGSTFLGLIALALVMVPTAGSFDFSFGGGQISYERDEDQQRQEQLIVSNQAMLKNAEYLEETISTLVSTTESNYTELLSLVVDIRDKQGGVSNDEQQRLQKLLADQKAAALTQAKPKSFKISTDSLVFNKVCEKANSTGEFYYSFLANGRPISDLSLENREPAKAGDLASLPASDPVIIPLLGDGDTFTFNGSIREYDGKSWINRKQKVTIVGDVRKAIPLEDKTHVIEFHTENSRDVCLATLTLSVAEWAG